MGSRPFWSGSITEDLFDGQRHGIGRIGVDRQSAHYPKSFDNGQFSSRTIIQVQRAFKTVGTDDLIDQHTGTRKRDIAGDAGLGEVQFSSIDRNIVQS